MNVSGVLLHVRPARLEDVVDLIAQLEGVEVHATSPEGRVVVTIEGETDRELAEISDHFLDVPGVLSAIMVYHSSELETA